jgi:hypothetical protein
MPKDYQSKKPSTNHRSIDDEDDRIARAKLFGGLLLLIGLFTGSKLTDTSFGQEHPILVGGPAVLCFAVGLMLFSSAQLRGTRRWLKKATGRSNLPKWDSAEISQVNQVLADHVPTPQSNPSDNKNSAT